MILAGGGYTPDVEICFCEGYYKLEAVHQMQDIARALFINDIRKQSSKTRPTKEASRALDIVEISQTKMQNADGPK